MIVTSQEKGIIKELHGVDCAPYSAYAQEKQGRQPEIEALYGLAGFPRSRLHDCCGRFGGCYYVDVPNIFRNFDADENDPANYDFYYTDEYIGAIIKAGAQIVYRLGVTIEWGTKKYTCYPPKDPAKWARICEHIVRHYNEGWADGFEYGIEYWEIWNEPENPPMWQGTREEFFELYRVASKHLKSCFGDTIKVGGYGSCGFYAHWQPERRDFYHSFLRWLEAFLEMCREENCPLDFFSWHIYTPRVDDVIISARYARERLDAHGFTKTESHLNEWNYGPEGTSPMERENIVGASFVAAVFAEMQREPVDMMQYYDARTMSSYNGFVNLRTRKIGPVAYVFSAFNKLFRAKTCLALEREEGDPYAVAATDGETVYALISNYNKGERTLEVKLPFVGEVVVSRLTDEDGFASEEAVVTDTLSLPCDDRSVYFIQCKAK